MTSPPSPPQGDWLHYRCLGLNLAAERPFTYHILPSKGPAELYFRLVDSPPLQWQPEGLEPLYTSPYRDTAGIPIPAILNMTKQAMPLAQKRVMGSRSRPPAKVNEELAE